MTDESEPPKEIPWTDRARALMIRRQADAVDGVAVCMSVIETIDKHFHLNPRGNQRLTTDEIEMVMLRRQALVILHHIRDEAAAALAVCPAGG